MFREQDFQPTGKAPVLPAMAMEGLMFCTNIRFVLHLMLICLTGSVVPASAQHFKQIAGTPLSQIAAGRAEVWGLYNSRVYRFDPNSESFGQIPGSLSQVAVGGGTLLQRDEVWGVNNGNAYRFDFNSNTLVLAPVSKECRFCLPILFSKIAVGGGDRDYCHPYEVWGLSYFPIVGIYRYNYCTTSFDNISSSVGFEGGSFTQIAVGPTGDVWGLWEGQKYPGSPIGSSIFEFTGYEFSPWVECACVAGSQVTYSWQQITVGTNQGWAVDSNGVVWFWAPPIQQDNTAVIFEGPGCPGELGCPTGFITNIASGGDGVWFLYNVYHGPAGQLGRYDGGFGFPTVPLPADANPNAVQIAVGSGAGVWVLDASDEVFTFVRP
jgi:Tectonin domain